MCERGRHDSCWPKKGFYYNLYMSSSSAIRNTGCDSGMGHKPVGEMAR